MIGTFLATQGVAAAVLTASGAFLGVVGTVAAQTLIARGNRAQEKVLNTYETRVELYSKLTLNLYELSEIRNRTVTPARGGTTNDNASRDLERLTELEASMKELGVKIDLIAGSKLRRQLNRVIASMQGGQSASSDLIASFEAAARKEIGL